jgi:hypothetical protein
MLSAARLSGFYGKRKADKAGESGHKRTVVLASGNLSTRSIAWKRGSLRSGSRRGSVLRMLSPVSRSRRAFSSHSQAF